MKAIFTVPKVVKYDTLDKAWYVFFRYGKGDQRKLYRYTCGINRIKGLKERAFEFEALRKALHERLKSGWNPLIPDVTDDGAELSVSDALRFAMEKKKDFISHKTYVDYSCTLKFVVTAINDMNLRYLTISDLKRVHVKAILENIRKKRKWSNKAYNKHLGYLQAILSELIQWDLLETNPAHKIKPLPQFDENANRVPTQSEYEKIKEALLGDPDYFEFVLCEFHTGIRPVEITKIRFANIDVERQAFVLPARNTKTGKDRIVPINQHFWEVVTRRMEGMPAENYLFGRSRQNSKAGRTKEKIQYFVPGPERMARSTSTRRWKKLIKDGLGIDVNQYAMKHYGADMKILAGIDLAALSELYGHSSKQMTEKYARKVKDVYRMQIMERSPEF